MPARAVLAVVAVPVLAGAVFVTVAGGNSDQPTASAAVAPLGGCVITSAASTSPTRPTTPEAAPRPASMGDRGSDAAAWGEGRPVSTVRLSAQQVSNARTIISVVKGRGLPRPAALIALATAWTESTLNNYSAATDHDSLGLFQQRPSQGWGSPAQVTDPVYATGEFLDRMLRVRDWSTRDVGAVAQAVQHSQYPGAYDARGLPVAAPLTAQLWDGTAAISSGGSIHAVSCVANPVASGPAAAKVAAVLARARSALGLPYCWAGGTATGPSHGTGGSGCDGSTVGFDCSGLALYAWAAAGVTLPHLASAQAQSGTRVPLARLQPGDLVFLANPTEGIHHVMIVWSMNPDGTGQLIEAQDFGVPVHIRAFKGAAEPEIVGYGVRPLAGPPGVGDR